MTDFSKYLADEIVEWFSQNTDMPTAPDTLYVTVFDTTGTERDGDFTDARKSVTTTGSEWTITNSAFENANNISLGEASTNVDDITDVAIYDSDTGGSNNELARFEFDQAPFNVAQSTELVFEPGDLSFDVVDNQQ